MLAWTIRVACDTDRRRTIARMQGSITRPAHAKINLCLSVGRQQPQGTIHEGKDVSGYHTIASWMACIDLHDTVTITRDVAKSGTSIAWAKDAPRTTPIDWPIEKDLAFRAHALLEKKVGRALPVSIRVEKRIPVGGGFGGGSSDAATTLIILNELFELGLTGNDLREIAFVLGSDVAFFIDGPDDSTSNPDAEEESSDSDSETNNRTNVGFSVPRPALVSSFGDAIDRFDPIATDLVVVVPPFGCETRAVYRAFDELLAIRVESKKAEIAAHKGQEFADRYEAQDARDDLVAKRIEKAMRSGEIDSDTLFNDLFLPAVHVEHRVGTLVTPLSKATRTPAHLTGSGSGIFLLATSGKVDKVLAKVRTVLETSGVAGAIAFPARLM